jgi:hypothetical protein
VGRAGSVPSKTIPLAVLALSVSFLIAARARSRLAARRPERDERPHPGERPRPGLVTYRAGGRFRRVLG